MPDAGGRPSGTLAPVGILLFVAASGLLGTLVPLAACPQCQTFTILKAQRGPNTPRSAHLGPCGEIILDPEIPLCEYCSNRGGHDLFQAMQNEKRPGRLGGDGGSID